MIAKRTAAAAVLTAALAAGCAGNGSIPQQNAGSTPFAMTLHVPGSSTTLKTGKRVRLYTSRDSNGLGIEYRAAAGGYSGAPSAAPKYGQALSATASGCAADGSNDGGYTCTIYVPSIPQGYDDIRVSLWNAAPANCGANGSGCSFSATGDKVLSSAALTNYAVAGGLSNTLGFTLLPVVDSVGVALSKGIVDPGNATGATVTAYVTPKDAAGDVILTADQLIDATGANLTLTLNIANDLGGSCPAAGAGNQTSANGCSLYFGTSGSPASANPAIAHGNDAATVQTISYDGSQTFPVNGRNEPAVTVTSSSAIAGANVPGAFTVCSTPAVAGAPAVTNQGTAGTSTYYYEIVAENFNGDQLPGAAGSTTTGNATLDGTNYNHVAWSGVPGAGTYIVLRSTDGVTYVNAGSVNGTTTAFDDQGLGSSSYVPATPQCMALPGGTQ